MQILPLDGSRWYIMMEESTSICSFLHKTAHAYERKEVQKYEKQNKQSLRLH